ncbi:MAG: hypothetical protein RL758_282 [Pseudomonadota bacterium]|jgi:hypothetical protein
MWLAVVSFLRAVSPRAWAIVAVVAALSFTHMQAYRRGGDAVQERWDKASAAQRAAVESERVEAKRREDALSASAAIQQKEHDEQVTAIRARLDRALISLRQRAARRPDVPTAAAACKGATGADLSGPDGIFLAREAARAERLRGALAACYQQYDAAREALNR